MKKRFLKLESIEKAKEIVNRYIFKDVEEIEIEKSVNKILAEDIFSDVDIPPFDRAVMDGYAVRAEDTYEADEDNPITLKVVDCIKAGDVKDISIKRGECVEISTGAMVPKGANAVVMVEYTERDNNIVKIYKAVAPMENIQFTGSDIMAGELVLRKYTRLTPRDIGVLAAIGKRKVKVFKTLKFGIISSGNELIPPTEKLKEGKIYDVNSYTLMSYINYLGYKYEFFGIAKDNIEDIKERIKKALESCDIVLISGGTSAGEGDLTERAIKELGGKILIHGLKVKPGKPTIIGTVNNKLVVGLPGYPTSCLTIFDILFGDEKNVVKAHFPLRYISAKGRKEFLPVILAKDKAYPITKGSGAITSLSEADGYIVIDENREILENEDVEVHLFGNVKEGLNIIGSHCIGIDLILREAKIYAKTINAGSLGGIFSIKRGEADIAGIHLLDEKTNLYNIPFLERYKVRGYLVGGYIREQGFMFREDLNIESIEDILKNIYNLKFINRNKGSGTRILFDKFLKEHNIDKNRINGYNIESKTHSAVARAIAMKKADIGLGIKNVAEQYNLKFIKLADEYYDFLINKDSFENRDVQRFIETLKKIELPFKKHKDTGKIIWKNLD
ncbi:molybdopterin biosynthesis protein [Methanocaldococcus indicus]|uniref:molybdopterin biosynthesis protein n=1 Tax=Methanocaldococcus indicus TaxID=213231 RepID=UPI003C6CC9B9